MLTGEPALDMPSLPCSRHRKKPAARFLIAKMASALLL
jgi:hypothetical protein